MQIVKLLLKLVFVFFILGAITLFIAYRYFTADLPSVVELKKIPVDVELEHIPVKLVEAVIIAEDRSFYQRAPISLMDFLQPSVINSGGHISQQIAKNLLIMSETNLRPQWKRQLKELVLTVQIEQTLTKDEILQIYLNQVYLGNETYGVRASAYKLFAKELNQLTLTEMTTIAAMIKSPTYYNPTFYPEHVMQRRNMILKNMLDDSNKQITTPSVE